MTEDADLGVRLHKAGYATRVMDSTTLEEATARSATGSGSARAGAKGYYQTWLVHMRSPVQLLRQLGLKGFISFNSWLAAPSCSCSTRSSGRSPPSSCSPAPPGSASCSPDSCFYAAASMLFIGNFTFLYMNIAGALPARLLRARPLRPAQPALLGTHELGLWKGAIQLITKPFYWEKTVHGLDQPSQGATHDRHASPTGVLRGRRAGGARRSGATRTRAAPAASRR